MPTNIYCMDFAFVNRCCPEHSGIGSSNFTLMSCPVASWRPSYISAAAFPCPTPNDWWRPCWIYRYKPRVYIQRLLCLLFQLPLLPPASGGGGGGNDIISLIILISIGKQYKTHGTVAHQIDSNWWTH